MAESAQSIGQLLIDAKAKLFTNLSDDAVAVVNADEEFSQRMTRDCQARIISYGIKSPADYRARSVHQPKSSPDS